MTECAPPLQDRCEGGADPLGLRLGAERPLMLALEVLHWSDPSTCFVVYFYSRPEPQMTVVCWNRCFVALNVVQIVRFVAARRRHRRVHSPAKAGRVA